MLTGHVVGKPKLVVNRFSPEHNSQLWQFDLVVDSTLSQDSSSCELVGKRIALMLDPSKWPQVPSRSLYAGSTLALKARLKPYHDLVNQVGVMQSVQLEAIKAGRAAKGSVQALYQYQPGKPELSQRITKSLSNNWKHSASSRLWQAMVLGDRQGFSSQDWQLLRQTGLAHIFAISGFHLGLLFFWVRYLSYVVLRIFALKWVYWPLPQISVLCALSSVWVYSWLTGFALSTQRAAIMISCMAIAWLARVVCPLEKGWLIALFAVLCADPLAYLEWGFWLSFTAVGYLILVFRWRPFLFSKWQVYLVAQCVLLIALAPVLVAMQSAWYPFGFLFNALLLPVFSFLIIPGMWFVAGFNGLLGGFLGGEMLVYADKALVWFWQQLQWLSDLSPSVQVNQQPWVFVLSVLAGLIVCMPGPRGRLLVSAILFSALFWPMSNASLPKGIWTLTIADAGQGLAIWVRVANKILVYDTGPGVENGWRFADRIMVPWLKQLGINQIDTLVVSHGDQDHASGLQDLLRHFDVKQQYSGTPSRWPNSPMRLCRQDSWQWQQLHFEFIRSPVQDTVSASSNDRSCLLKITDLNHPGNTWLIPGDIERDIERDLFLKSLKNSNFLQAKYLIAPHHGSLTSSSNLLITRVKPAVVVFSAGAGHRFGHPHAKVVKRYQKHGVDTLYTANTGALRYTFAHSGDVQVTAFRSGSRWFWHH